MKVKILKCEFEEFIGTEQEVYYQFSNGINFITSYGMVFVPKENYEVTEEGLSQKSLHKRASMVRAMDNIARSVNDEELVVGYWFSLGVADGDITDKTTDEDLEGYCDDDTFKDLMHTFLVLMEEAKKDGGLYCDGITAF
jgi:hypothetical protein